MKKVLALLLVVSAIGFVIGGCNKGDDAAATPAATTGTAGAGGAAATPAAPAGGAAATPAAPATTTGG